MRLPCRGAIFLAALAVVFICPAVAAYGVAPRPQVICIASSSPVESPVGFYAKQPRGCNFHERGQPAAYAYLLEMRRIHWLHWGARIAVGSGKALANMVGPVAARVRLSVPSTVCGHRVFTLARFKFNHGGFGKGMQLDRRLSGCR
ncbi:MAG TPA: hypothetical protein VFG58_10315 [Solirubrobacterales bacterium]|nr:hypothetical protein [Solirubrobacterales bacterium]